MRHKVAVWIAGVVLGFAVVAAIAVSLVFRSAWLHSYVLNKVQKEASASLGVQVQLQNYALRLSDLRLDLYGLTVHGATPYPDPPLLEVAHAEASLRIVSILHKKWYLDSLVIDQPVVKVFSDAHGVTNIPTFKSSGSSSSNTTVFDVGIRHAVLDRGAAFYNNRQSVLSADLHNLDFRASFNSLLQKYSGRLSYADGHLLSGNFKPIPHNLEAEFDATPTTFHLQQGKLTSDTSQVVLTATLENYSNPQVQGQYTATLDGAQFRKILSNPSLPTGIIRATGSMAYQETANRPLLDTVTVHGDLHSKQLAVQTAALSSQIKDIAAHYKLENGDATLLDFRAALLGGELTSNGKMSNLSGDSHAKFNAALRGIQLADVNRALKSQAMPKGVTLAGALNAQADAEWGKTFDDLVAHADGNMQGKISGNARILPLESVIHGTYTGKNQELAVKQSVLKTPQNSLTLNGTLSRRSALDVKFQSNNLGELETVADVFRSSGPPLGLAGTTLFEGVVRGSTSDPHLTGQLTASNFHLNGTAWKVLRTNVDVSPSMASLEHADLEPAAHGKITFNASTGLHNWAFTDASLLQVDLDAAQMDVADLVKLSGQQVPVTGTLAANIHVHGTELSPVGQGKVSVTHITAYDQPVNSATLNFAGTGDEVHGDLGVQLPAGDVQSKVSVRPRQKTYSAQLTASGIQLQQLQALKAQNIDARGVVSLQGSGAGTFDNPQADVTLTIPQVDVQNQKIADVNLKMNVANHLAKANLTSSAVGTAIRANATVHLTGDYLADATLDTQTIPLQPIFAIYAPQQAADLSGQTEIHGTLHGPLKNKKLLEAHVTIPTLKLAYTNAIQLTETSPIHVDYKDTVVTLQRSGLKGTDTDLQFGGSMPTTGSAPISLLLLGTVNLRLAQVFQPGIRSSGELKFNINSTGAANGPDLAGQIEIVDANYASGDLPVGLQHGNGVLTLTKDRLNISKFQGTVGGGTVTAQGGVVYRPAVQFDLGLTANGVRALYPDGVRETVNADLRLAGSTDNAVLGGQVRLADLSFTPSFDLNSFINQFSGGVSAPATPGMAQNIQLNIGVTSENNINLVSRTVSINGSANLRVRGTAAMPVILGRVNLDGGDIILNGSRYILNGGTIEFVNPSETEPVVNLALNTTIQQYDISLRFNGPVDQLRTNYSSDPSLPPADIINLLAFGTTTEASAMNATPANQAAESLVASQVSSQVTSRVSKVAGISQLSINPVLAGGTSQGPPGANITIQQRVTGNLFVTFSSNVASTQNQTIQGQYQLSPRVAVSATRDQNGGFGFDTLIKKTW
ncbi:MAG: translocation/assembly module TamB domain-containing protein [Acidobacteriaceae bacterium]